MTNPIVNISSGNTTYVANLSDTDYLLADGVTRSSALPATIDASSAATGRTFAINGEIVSNLYGILVGISAFPATDNSIVIGATGFIHGTGTAIQMVGDGHSVINHGTLASAGKYGIKIIGDDGTITNDGVINAPYGIILDGNNSHILNKGTISGTEGIVVQTVDGETSHVNNRGWISGSSMGILTGDGDDHLRNSGDIYGGVSLGDGNDTFLNAGGGLSGIVRGGDGNDTFVFKGAAPDISGHSWSIQEDANQGFDTVKTNRSFTITSSIEMVRLTGSADVNATGFSGNEFLYGNKGDNTLSGMDGIDYLNGGQGSDWLTGGNGSDTFVFGHGFGTDVISDFEHGIDHISMTGFANTSFADMMKFHAVNKMGYVEITYGDDVLTLIGVTKADLHAADFSF